MSKKEFKFTKNQKELYDKCTNMQRKIVINVVHTKMSNRAAYYEAGGKAKSHSSADSTVTQILSKPQVKAFYDSLIEQAAGDAIMTREESLEILTSIGRANITDLITYQNYEVIDKEGELVNQSAVSIVDSDQLEPAQSIALQEVSQTNDGIKIKMYSKIDAIKKISEIEGWNAASKHEHSGPDGDAIEMVERTDEDTARKLAFLLTKGDTK